MNEHDGLEPTVAMPRVDVRPSAAIPSQPIPAQPIPPPPLPVQAREFRYVFGNPLTYALRRFLAFGLDFVVITAVATMLLYGLIAINPFTGLPNNSEGGFDATVGLGVAIALVSLWLFESIFGTSLGKLACSLHVYVPNRRFVGFGRAFIRNLMRPVDLLVIGWILAMLPGHRRLGDLLGGTIVAQSPLRAFAPLVGWLLLIALGALPFLVAGGTVTALAVGTAFVEFVPPLLMRIAHTVHHWLLAAPLHLPGSTG